MWMSIQQVMPMEIAHVNGQTVLMRTSTQGEFVECWIRLSGMVSPREAIIRNGLPPVLVDDPLFRKTLVTTSRTGQTVVCMDKGTSPGKRDTRDGFTLKGGIGSIRI
jgi:hypothetical protein